MENINNHYNLGTSNQNIFDRKKYIFSINIQFLIMFCFCKMMHFFKKWQKKGVDKLPNDGIQIIKTNCNNIVTTQKVRQVNKKNDKLENVDISS